MEQEAVGTLVVGMPKHLDNTASPMTAVVIKFVKALQKIFPDKRIISQDERYTSKMAKNAMIEMGMKKKDRQNKKLVDEIAATIMLQEYLRAQEGNL